MLSLCITLLFSILFPKFFVFVSRDQRFIIINIIIIKFIIIFGPFIGNAICFSMFWVHSKLATSQFRLTADFKIRIYIFFEMYCAGPQNMIFEHIVNYIFSK